LGADKKLVLPARRESDKQAITFGEIYGHDRQKAFLRAAVTAGRLAHAYLFHGCEGIGKKTMAGVFAAALLCDRGADEACGSCLACRKVKSGNHPDLIRMAAEGAFIKMQAVRELMAAMAFRPMEGGRRIFIIEDADRMHHTAANALLKTLEEPAAANVLLLVTAKPFLLPRTILSRCQQLRFSPLPRETVARFLREAAAVDENTARAIAAGAEGSIARARQLLGEDFLEARQEIMGRIADPGVGAPLERLALLRCLGRSKKDIPDRLSLLQSCFRDAMIWKETGDVAALAHADRRDDIRRLARLNTEDLLFNLETVAASLRSLEANANKSLTLEAMTFTLRL